jgi:hypothetical protein
MAQHAPLVAVDRAPLGTICIDRQLRSQAQRNRSSMKDPERPCSIRPQLRSLQNVLQRSVEPAIKSDTLAVCRSLPVCTRLRTCRYTAITDALCHHNRTHAVQQTASPIDNF